MASSAWCITEPKGALRPDSLADFAPHAQVGKTYNEFWTYLFRFSNGTQLEVNLSHAFFGSFKDPICGAGFALTNFRSGNYLVAREYKNSNFSFDAAKVKLNVHENIFFEGRPPSAHRLYFSTTKKNVSYFADLTFHDMEHGVVWGDGTFHLDDGQQSALFIHIPRGQVRGRIAINGDTLAVDGSVWMDHSWQTHFAPKLINAGYRYELPSGPVEGGYFFRTGNAMFGYGVRGEGGKLSLLRPVAFKTLENMEWAGVGMPRAFELDFDGARPAICRWKEQRQWRSAFAELGTMERFAAKLFLGGTLYSFRGVGTVNDSSAFFSFTVVER